MSDDSLESWDQKVPRVARCYVGLIMVERHFCCMHIAQRFLSEKKSVVSLPWMILNLADVNGLLHARNKFSVIMMSAVS